jgi:cation transport ATPase
VFLGGDFESVIDTVKISKRTIHIATQSIVAGIGISTVGMLIAAFGFIPAVVGAFVQEAIDIMVIFNALRASKSE